MSESVLVRCWYVRRGSWIRDRMVGRDEREAEED